MQLPYDLPAPPVAPGKDDLGLPKNHKITRPFNHAFKSCAPASCMPIFAVGYRENGNPRSCFNQLAAINLFGIKCKGDERPHMAGHSQKFDDVMTCIRGYAKSPSGRADNMKVLYQTDARKGKTQGFFDNAWIAANCSLFPRAN